MRAESDTMLGLVRLISQKHEHLLWKDELGDPFLLTRYGEIVLHQHDVLRVYCWSAKIRAELLSEDLVLEETETDDPFHILDVGVQHLARLIDLGAFRRRPDIRGRWIRGREQVLGHRILPYWPDLPADRAHESRQLELRLFPAVTMGIRIDRGLRSCPGTSPAVGT